VTIAISPFFLGHFDAPNIFKLVLLSHFSILSVADEVISETRRVH
jgi:hypothetical protein